MHTEGVTAKDDFSEIKNSGGKGIKDLKTLLLNRIVCLLFGVICFTIHLGYCGLSMFLAIKGAHIMWVHSIYSAIHALSTFVFFYGLFKKKKTLIWFWVYQNASMATVSVISSMVITIVTDVPCLYLVLHVAVAMLCIAGSLITRGYALENFQ